MLSNLSVYLLNFTNTFFSMIFFSITTTQLVNRYRYVDDKFILLELDANAPSLKNLLINQSRYISSQIASLLIIICL